MNITKTVALLGGPAQVSQILNLKSPRYVSEVVAGTRSVPSSWVGPLRAALLVSRDAINVELGAGE